MPGSRIALPLALAFAALAATPGLASAYPTGVSLTTEGPSQIATLRLESQYGPPLPVELSPIKFPPTATDTQLVGLAFRPGTEDLYAMARGGTLYVLQGPPYKAVQVNPTPALSPLQGTHFSLTFDPVRDAIKVVDDAEQSLLFSPFNGQVLEEATLAYGPPGGPTPAPAGAAFVTVSSGPFKAYRMYVLDSATDHIAVLGKYEGPETGAGGQLTEHGPLGLDISAVGGFAALPDSEFGQAIVQPAGGGPQELCSVDSTTEQASAPPLSCHQDLAAEQPLTGLAVNPSAVIEFSEQKLTGHEGETVYVPIRRRGSLDRVATARYGFVIPEHSPAGEFGTPSGTLSFLPGEMEKTIPVPIPKANGGQPPWGAVMQLTDAGPDTSLGNEKFGLIEVVGNEANPTVVRPKASLKQVLRQRLLKVRYHCDGPCRPSFDLKVGGTPVSSAGRNRFETGPGVAVLRLGAKSREAIADYASRGGAVFHLSAFFGTAGPTVYRKLRLRLSSRTVHRDRT
jgi:Domain of unknown function (DUF4394)